MKYDMKLLRATVRSILAEAAYTKSDMGEFTFEFPVYGRNDEEVTVTATYDPRRPFEVECWQAFDTSSGLEVDIDAIKAQHPDLESTAMDWVGTNLDSSS